MKNFKWNTNDRRKKLAKLIEDGLDLVAIHSNISKNGLPTTHAIKRQALALGYGVKKGLFTRKPESYKKRSHAGTFITTAEAQEDTQPNEVHAEVIIEASRASIDMQKFENIIYALNVLGLKKLAKDLKSCVYI